MKKLLILLLLLTSFISMAQNAGDKPGKTTPRSELSLQYNFGFSNRNFQLPPSDMFGRLNYTQARSYYDRGIMLRYNFAVLQKGKNRLLLGTGVGYSNSQHYQVLTGIKYDYQLDAVVFDAKAITIPLTISYERAFFDDKFFLELSYSRNYNIAQDKNAVYQSEAPGKQDFINYTYTLEVRNENRMNNYIAITPKFRVIDNLFINCSIGYLTNKKVNYNYTVNTDYVTTDAQTGNATFHYESVQSLSDIEIIDKYLYLSLGVAYKF